MLFPDMCMMTTSASSYCKVSTSGMAGDISQYRHLGIRALHWVITHRFRLGSLLEWVADSRRINPAVALLSLSNSTHHAESTKPADSLTGTWQTGVVPVCA